MMNEQETASGTPINIRWMTARDMDTVLVIEDGAFEFPWTKDDFIRVLRQRNVIGKVVDDGRRVLGFMVYELCKSHIHVMNFAVASGYRRRRIGRQMMQQLIGRLSVGQKRSQITTEVRERNLDAQLFFRNMGFSAQAIVKHYFQETDEDAYQFVYGLANASKTESETGVIHG